MQKGTTEEEWQYERKPRRAVADYVIILAPEIGDIPAGKHAGTHAKQ
jgi:hypothetical protein